MSIIWVWRVLTAKRRTIELTSPPVCSRNPDHDVPCPRPPAWVLAWTVNESGMPGLGEARHDYVCAGHVSDRLYTIPFEYTGAVTIEPIEEYS